MDERCVCELLERLFRISTMTGMVAVPSGFVTQDDMNRADAAARESNSITPLFFLKRECYVLSNGDCVQDPIGMQSSRLDAIWKFAAVNADKLKELLEKCDEIS